MLNALLLRCVELVAEAEVEAEGALGARALAGARLVAWEGVEVVVVVAEGRARGQPRSRLATKPSSASTVGRWGTGPRTAPRARQTPRGCQGASALGEP